MGMGRNVLAADGCMTVRQGTCIASWVYIVFVFVCCVFNQYQHPGQPEMQGGVM